MTRIWLHLSYCSLVTSYGEINWGQHWFRQRLVVRRHHSIIWTNVDLSSVRSIDIHLWANSHVILLPPMTKITRSFCFKHVLQISYWGHELNAYSMWSLSLLFSSIWNDRFWNMYQCEGSTDLHTDKYIYIYIPIIPFFQLGRCLLILIVYSAV